MHHVLIILPYHIPQADGDLNIEALHLLLEMSRVTLENLSIAAAQYNWEENSSAGGKNTVLMLL